MNDVEAVLRGIAAVLEAGPNRWAVVGALAIGVRAEPRFTRDVDIAIAAADDADAEALVHRLRGLGYEVLATVEHDVTGRLATARLSPPGGDEGSPVVDLLFASSGIEREIVEAATEVEVVPHLLIPVATSGHLIAMKLLSETGSRPLDRADLFALVEAADAGELERAREAVQLIVERGTHRGRDLGSALADLISH